MDGTPLLWRKADRVGVVHRGGEKDPERPHWVLPVPDGVLWESWRGNFCKDMYW